MAVRSQRVLASFLAGDDSRRPSAAQVATIPITLAPKPGVTPSAKAPVRIYLGTESAQFRAERAFVWSIERVRDPARRYEIHLMKDFAGFERWLWLTGFTNYRFAIPELAGRAGRAIYNDADQIYLNDPALLFDTPMGAHGVLSINDRDTSVMLIDCARMAELWNWQSAKSTKNRELESRMRAVDGLWGELDSGWNARDEEYTPATSHLLHYTTIHTQPWRPSPRDYVYRANVAGAIWRAIETEADAAGFQLFDADHPTPEFAAAATATPETGPDMPALDEVRRLIDEAKAESIYYCGFRDAAAIRSLARGTGPGADNIEYAMPAAEREAQLLPASVDVVVADGLERLPDLDMPWLLDRLFGRARQAVIVTVTLDENGKRRCPADPYWWYAQMTAAGARCPQRHWRLVVRKSRRLPAGARYWRWSGGVLLRIPPTTWVLQHYKTGHRSQAMGVADALGWAYETREIPDAPARSLLSALAAQLPIAARADSGLPAGICPPWPDLIIASGWLPGLVARRIRELNLGNTRLVLMGRRGGPVGESQDLEINCRHFGLTPHPQQLETVLPPSKVGADRIAAAGQRWPDVFGKDALRPRVAFLVGGTSGQHELSTRRAGTTLDRLREAARSAGATLAVLTSRRTGDAVTRTLAARTGDEVIFEPWQQAADGDNPFLGYLAHADILVVTGESESMLAEAVATGKPVYIVPLPERAPSPRQRVADWVHAQAQTDRYNARGSRRPQQGLQYLSARLVEQRILLPRRDMAALHEELVQRGLARIFEGHLEVWQPSEFREIESLAAEIRRRLAPAPANAGASEQSHAARG